MKHLTIKEKNDKKAVDAMTAEFGNLPSIPPSFFEIDRNNKDQLKIINIYRRIARLLKDDHNYANIDAELLTILSFYLLKETQFINELSAEEVNDDDDGKPDPLLGEMRKTTDEIIKIETKLGIGYSERIRIQKTLHDMQLDEKDVKSGKNVLNEI